MDSLIDSLGLLCMAIQEGQDKVGRTKLQKMFYFADRYLDWDVGDYSLHYYGPYSQNLSLNLRTAREELVKESKHESGRYQYELTKEGDKLLQDFEDNFRDETKINKTRALFRELSDWRKEDLELASTLDHVNNCFPRIQKDDLIQEINIMKEHHTLDSIKHAYELWSDWKAKHNF